MTFATWVGIAVFSIGAGFVHARLQRTRAERAMCTEFGHIWAEEVAYEGLVCLRCGCRAT